MAQRNNDYVDSPHYGEEAAPQGRLKIFFGYAAGVGKTYLQRFPMARPQMPGFPRSASLLDKERMNQKL